MDRLFAIALAVDQLFNAIVNKSPDETFSAACFRKAPYGKKRWIFLKNLIDNLFFWDYEWRDGKKIKHCHLSFESELSRKHFPNEYKERK